jgi:hypothetical protein
MWTASLCHLTDCGQIADLTHPPIWTIFIAGIHKQGHSEANGKALLYQHELGIQSTILTGMSQT